MGQEKYDNCIMVRWCGTKNVIDNAFSIGIDRKLQSTPNVKKLWGGGWVGVP